jgi:hypothetical protein
VHKMKYDESYRFEQEGEDEATFQEFRWKYHTHHFEIYFWLLIGRGEVEWWLTGFGKNVFLPVAS